MKKLLELCVSILRHRITAHLIFWLWNGLFMSVAAFGLIPIVLGPMLTEANKGLLPWSLFFTVAAMTAIPFAASAIGLFLLRKRKNALLAFFYGVEAPLFLLALCRVFLVRELTPGVTYVLAVFALGCAALVMAIFFDRGEPSRARRIIDLILGTVALAAGVYASTVLFFYAVPIGAYMFRWVIDPHEWLELLRSPIRSALEALFTALAMASIAFFAAMPFAVIALYAGRYKRAASAFAAKYGAGATALITAWCLAMLTFGFVRTNTQPQQKIFTMLEKKPVTDAELRALVAESDAIREGLLNAYLSRHRYVAAAGSDHSIRYLWRDALKIDEEKAQFAQGLWESLVAPWIYDGGEDRARASELYARFFDAPIQKNEKAVILNAIKTTWDRADREAGLLDEGNQIVHVERQTLSVVEHGDFAEVELHEVYQNETASQQEVFYAFSLPATAVLNGLYLGDTDERARRFPFVIAPRGAAQSVYKQEVARRVDPALLEQIGPRQYRLRAFPVPPNGVLHLWLSYDVLVDDGVIPLPRLSEQRNVYLDQRTERFVGAVPLRLDEQEAWLPSSIPAHRATPPRAHTVQLSPHLFMRAEPVDTASMRPKNGDRFAIVIDTSRSMEEHKEELVSDYAWLMRSIVPSAGVEVYLSGAEGMGRDPQLIDDPRRYDPEATIFFGGQNPRRMLEQFVELRCDRAYDGVIVLTDGGSYDLAKDKTGPLVLGAPLWMVHLGGALPPGYDDGTLEAIESSGGGVTTDIRRAFAGIAFSESDLAARTGGTIEDGYIWTVEPAENATIKGESEPHFATLAARQLIRDDTKWTRKGVFAGLETLDHIHGIAKRFGIVSAYSSMLVLVNDEQRERLARAESKADRFDREVETGTKDFSSPLGGFPSLTATPEPHEWALLAVVSMVAIFLWRRQNALRT